MVFKINSFVNEAGSKVEELVPIEDNDGSVEVQFVGVAQLVSDYASTEIRFPIDEAKTLDDAFSMFEKNLNEFMDSMRKQMEEQANKPEIIVPDSITPDMV
jgi:hypothetical protein|tara:strand:+ start:1491 stop:1793 length:303 start_codon:yes stop_codon:yes gene_type:complete